jgi:adenylosuccinate synthase
MSFSKFITIVDSDKSSNMTKISNQLINQYSKKYGKENIVVLGVNGASDIMRTTYFDDDKYDLYYFTTASINKGIMQILGSDKIIEPISLKDELSTLSNFPDLPQRTYIDEETYITTIPHIIFDRNSNSNTLNKGIKSTLYTKYNGFGIRLCDAIDMTDDELLCKLKSLYDNLGFTSDIDLVFNYIDFSMNSQPFYLNTTDILSGIHDLRNIRWIQNTFNIVNHTWFRENILTQNKIFIAEMSVDL